jgi:hypothetical protein
VIFGGISGEDVAATARVFQVPLVASEYVAAERTVPYKELRRTKLSIPKNIFSIELQIVRHITSLYVDPGGASGSGVTTPGALLILLES